MEITIDKFLLDKSIEKSKNKKQLFLGNINFAKKLLKEGISIKEQSKKFSHKIEKINESTYAKYSREFLPDEYRQSTCKVTFQRNLLLIREYIINNTKLKIKKSELYNYLLLEKKTLQTVAFDKKSNLTYLEFKRELEELFIGTNFYNMFID